MNQNLTLAPHESKRLIDTAIALSAIPQAIAKLDGDRLMKVLERIAVAVEKLAAQSTQKG